MKLRSYRVREFRSIWDSGEIKVEDKQTCLVGKNEAGKTALLHALYKTNPIIEKDGGFNLTHDYPKRQVVQYRKETEQKTRDPVVVVESVYELDEDDRNAVSAALGPDTLICSRLTHSSHYDGDGECRIEVKADEAAAIQFLTHSEGLSQEARVSLEDVACWSDFRERLEKVGDSNGLLGLVTAVAEQGLDAYIAREILITRMPSFMYFDDYHQMKGRENLDALVQRIQGNALEDRDHPLLGLLGLADLDPELLLHADNTQELKDRLEAAGNFLTDRIAGYWSQNRHISMKFDVRPGKPGDPEGMREGVNLWGEIHNTVHRSTTPLSDRSKGFLWFFSFLAWYERVKTQGKEVILLLDEPGLSLHGRAQGDLLRFFNNELTPKHQLVYTTHSPFMVDANKFECVRIVQDLSIDSDKPLPPDRDGTKVHAGVHEATEDSLFPLHGALGLDIHQTLFIGPNSLVVEGVADLLFLQAMSVQLGRDGQEGLSDEWVIAPAGGIGKVSTFVSLLGHQKGLRIAVLLDIASNSRLEVEALYRSKLLKKKNVLTYADFIAEADEADVEDMFERRFYLDLVNAEFESELDGRPIQVDSLNANVPRVVKAVSAYLANKPMKSGQFSHYRPARYFNERVLDLWDSVDDDTKDRFERLFEALNKLL